MKRAWGEGRKAGKGYGKIENTEQQFRTAVCLDKAIEDGQQPKAAELSHGKILRKKQTRIPEAYTLFRGHNSAGACLVNDRDNMSNYNNLCGCIP